MTNDIQPNANVRAAMGLRGVKPFQIAEALNISRPSVSERLSGKTDFKTSELIKLSHFLQVPATSFFENTGFGYEPAPEGMRIPDLEKGLRSSSASAQSAGPSSSIESVAAKHIGAA